MSTEAVRTNKEIIRSVELVLQGAYKEYADFNTAMDAAGQIELPSLNPNTGSHKLFPSEAVFWADRNAYFDDLKFWENSSMEDRHRDAIEALKAGKLLPVFHDLVNAIKRHRVAPFVGAGMSFPSKFPLWGKALENMADKIAALDRAAFNAAMASYKYLEAAQLIWDADETLVKNEIRTVFAKAAIPPRPLAGPIQLLPKISRGCVITTNFDSVVETALEPEVIDGYMHGLQAENNFVARLIKGDRCIMKLHGDAETPASYIYTEKQYKKGYGAPFDFKKPLPRALRQIYVSHSMLFLGCSLEQDKTMELFQAVRNQKAFTIPDHFAILEEPATLAAKNNKESRLLSLGIRPLWYPNTKHEFVEFYLRLAIDVVEGRYKL